MYYLEYQNKLYCIDATKPSGRLGRLINHSISNVNLRPRLFEMQPGDPRIVFLARCEIKKNEELLYDYGDRRSESLANYPWLAYGMIHISN